MARAASPFPPVEEVLRKRRRVRGLLTLVAVLITEI